MTTPDKTVPATAQKSVTIFDLLTENTSLLREALPKTITQARFVRVALNTIARSPELLKCTATSLYAAIMQAAQLGLEVGLMNQAHLVPYWNGDLRCFEAQFQIGYLGLRDLAERYGDIVDGDAQIVYERDEFDYREGTDPSVYHKPAKTQDRGSLEYVYSWAQPKHGTLKVCVMSRSEIEAHRDKFAKRKKDGSFGPAWTVTFEMMALKTVMRKNYKLLARSPQLREAIALDEMAEIEEPQRLGAEIEAGQLTAAREENAKRLLDSQLNARPEDGAGARPLASVGPGAATSMPAREAPPVQPDPETTDDPAEPYRAKLRVALTWAAVSEVWRTIPDELKQDCEETYNQRLRSLKRPQPGNRKGGP